MNHLSMAVACLLFVSAAPASATLWACGDPSPPSISPNDSHFVQGAVREAITQTRCLEKLIEVAVREIPEDGGLRAIVHNQTSEISPDRRFTSTGVILRRFRAQYSPGREGNILPAPILVYIPQLLSSETPVRSGLEFYGTCCRVVRRTEHDLGLSIWDPNGHRLFEQPFGD